MILLKVISFFLRFLLISVCLSLPFFVYPQSDSIDFPNPEDYQKIAGEVFFSINENRKRRNAPIGTAANIAEICNLFNHPLFNNINYGDGLDLHPHEQVKFSGKLLEVPIDEIIDKFQSMIPFYTTEEIAINNFSSYDPNSINSFYMAMENGSPGDLRGPLFYALNLNQGNNQCLPRIVSSYLRSPGLNVIDWQSEDKYSIDRYSFNFDGGQAMINPERTCLMCIFFIREFHDDLKNRFDEILKIESIAVKNILKEARDKGINIQLDEYTLIPNDQSFKLKERVNSELRKRELTDFIKTSLSKNQQFDPQDYLTIDSLESKKREIIALEEKRKREEERDKKRLEAEEKRQAELEKRREEQRQADLEKKIEREKRQERNKPRLWLDIIFIIYLFLVLFLNIYNSEESDKTVSPKKKLDGKKEKTITKKNIINIIFLLYAISALTYAILS